MSMFQKTNEFNSIKHELDGMLDKEADFICFIDGMSVFGLESESCFYQFEIGSNDDFYPKMKIGEILKMREITYMRFSTHPVIEPGDHGYMMKEISWGIYLDSHLN